MKSKTLALALLLLGGCGRQDSGQNAPKAPEAPAAPATPEAPEAPEAPIAPVAPTAPSTPKVLSEPKGPIDPKSVEAAGQVVQSYGALVEQSRFTEAARLWRDPAAAAAFAKALRPATHMEIGELGDTEGAAGSIYTSVPVTFYRTGFRRPAEVVLRRVNDVPGSTAAQRRWHIERIDWKN
jgi:hypothetical protein